MLAKKILLTTIFMASFSCSGLYAEDAVDFSAADLEFFESKVRPLLIEHCYECHSVEAGEAEGGLRVDSRAGVLRGGDTGPAVR